MNHEMHHVILGGVPQNIYAKHEVKNFAFKKEIGMKIYISETVNLNEIDL